MEQRGGLGWPETPNDQDDESPTSGLGWPTERQGA